MRSFTILAVAGLGCVPAEYADEPAQPEAEVQTQAEANDPVETPPDDTEDGVVSMEDRLVSLKGDLKEVIVEPDVLMMGLDASDEDYSFEHLPHMVDLTHTWTIMETEVTHLQWEAHMDYACLLYTSPSPRDRTRSRMPSSA